MEFPTGTLIEDRRGEKRWRVKKIFFQHSQYTLWSVEDAAPTMGNRVLWMLTLNYQSLPDRDRTLAIGTLRESLYSVAKLLCANYTFLPEPVDIIQFVNNLDAMEPQQREHEVALVFAQSSGRSPTLISSDEQQLMAMKNRLLIPIIKTLGQLHKQKTIIQSIPVVSVNMNQITQSPYLMGFTSLIQLDNFVGYNANKSVLRPDPLYAAPECFDPDGRLSPATDVYALGKFILQLILKDKYSNYITRNNPFPKDLQNLVNSLRLPDPWPRFLALCLQHDPKQRFQNVNELEIFWKPKQEQEKIREEQQKQQQEKAKYQEEKAKWQEGRAQQIKKQQEQRAQEQERKKAQYHKPNSQKNASATTRLSYRENPDLPDAALIIWDENLTDRNEKFLYGDLYREFKYQYNFKPRLFFQKTSQSKNTDNPFFKMLQDTYGLQVVDFEQSQAVTALNYKLDPYLKQFKHLILVGHSDVFAVQYLLKHPHIKDWNVHWVRHKGQWNPADLQYHSHDITPFIRKKTA